MEIRAMRREIYKEPYIFKFINTFHSSAFRNRNIRSVAACTSAVIVIMKEDNLDKYSTKKQNLQLQIENLWSASSWTEKFNDNIFLYEQRQKPNFSEAVFISGIIMERLKRKVFDEVFICFKSKNRNKEDVFLLPILPVEESLSFVLPKYLESIIFGILLETYAS